MTAEPTESNTPVSPRLTQHCPNCGYDLWGLPEDRCPECGQRFVRSSLPVVEEGTNQRARLLWPLQAVALGLAWVHYSLGRGPTNTCFQLAWLGLMWGVAAAWVILRRRELSRPGRAPALLWLLILCAFTPTRPYLPDLWRLGTTAFALAVGIVILVIALRSSARRTAGYLAVAAEVVLLTTGALSIIFGLVGAVTGPDPNETTFTIFAWEFRGTRQNHLLIAVSGVVVVVAGLVSLRLTKRLLASDHDEPSQESS